MKFQLTFKCPDVLDQIKENYPNDDLWDDIKQFAKRYVVCDEYITVEFDTEKGTATGVPST